MRFRVALAATAAVCRPVLLRRGQAQGLLEYALILSIVSIAAVGSLYLMGSDVTGGYTDLGDLLSQLGSSV